MISMYLLNKLRDIEWYLRNRFFTPIIWCDLYKFGCAMKKHRENNCYNQIKRLVTSPIIPFHQLAEIVEKMLYDLEINRTLEYKEWKPYW